MAGGPWREGYCEDLGPLASITVNETLGRDHVDAAGSVNDCRGIAVTGIWGYEQIVEFRKRIGQGRSLCECGCESVAGLTPGAGAW